MPLVVKLAKDSKGGRSSLSLLAYLDCEVVGVYFSFLFTFGNIKWTMAF